MKKIILFSLFALLLFSTVSCAIQEKDDKAPCIQDGYWYIDGINTGVKAEGVDGENGKTPYIKDGYWYIGDVNTGVMAEASNTVTGAYEDNQGLAFYPQDDGTYVVSGGNAKYMKNIVIPEKYRGGAVVAVEENAFKDFTLLETLVIPNSVKTIGQGVFSGCTALTSISMPCYENTYSLLWLCLDAAVSSISSDDDIFIPPLGTINITGGTAIPNRMFHVSYGGEAEATFKSNLKVLTLPDSLTAIGESAFYSCPDEFFEEENGIKYIGKWAVSCTDPHFTLRSDTVGIATSALISQNYDFDESITSFTVPASVKYLSFGALFISPNIDTYVVEDENSEYCSIDGVVYTKDMKTLVQYPFAKEGERFDFPESIQKIASGAFYGTQVKTVTLPNDITEIPDSAFSSCALENINIPSSVTVIGANAFSGTNIKTFVWPDGIEEIPYGVFSGSSLSEITLPDTVTKIHAHAFSSTNISTIKIPDSVTEIGKSAFYGTELISITLPDGITEIADSTFYFCSKLVSVDIPDSVTKIGDNAFSQNDSLTFITLPKNIKSIGEGAFSYTALLSINIPKKLTHIGTNAFAGCHIIEIINEDNWSLDIRIGSTSNGYLAYYAKEIHSGESKIVNYDDYLFYSTGTTAYLIRYIGNDTELRLPENFNGGMYEIYKSAFESRNEYQNSPIYSVIIPDSVTVIGDLAFAWCYELKEIVIGKNVSHFGNQAFDECSELSAVYYMGDLASWNRITQYSWTLPNYIKEATRYYYSETEPAQEVNYWHYVNGVPTVW